MGPYPTSIRPPGRTVVVKRRPLPPRPRASWAEISKRSARGSSPATCRTAIPFRRGSNSMMVARMERESCWMAAGNSWTMSAKSTTPYSGAVAQSPRRVLSSARRWAAMDSTSSTGPPPATLERSPRPPMRTSRRRTGRRRARFRALGSAVRRPGVLVRDAAVRERPLDRVEHERDLLERRLRAARRDDRVRHDLLHRGDAALLDGDRVELLGGSVALGVRPEELEGPLDLLVLDERLHEERRRLVDALADEERLVLSSPGGHPASGLTRGDHPLLVVEALDGVLAPEALLRALPLDVRSVGLEKQMYGLSHGLPPARECGRADISAQDAAEALPLVQLPHQRQRE